jgi:putative ABC transport system permease protein
LINRLVVENLKYRPIRTLLSILVIGVQVTMVLTLVGLSRGVLDDQKTRARGAGADIVIRPSGSSILGASGNMNAKLLLFVQKQPHVRIATGTLIQGTGGLNSITGIDLKTFSAMSGGFRFLQGRPFTGPNEMIVDDYYANEHKLHVGDKVPALNRNWTVVGIVEPGILAREIVPLDVLQDLTANSNKLTMIYAKLDDSKLTSQVVQELKAAGLGDYPIYSMEEFVSLYSVNNVPMLKEFIVVIIGLGSLIGFLVVFLSMYTAVLERTREIGVLKALGASPGYILGILLRETTVLAVAGSIVGIVLTFGTSWIINSVVHGSLQQAIVPDWWPIAAGIAIVGAVIGALYPGLKAARQDAIEALSYE